MNEARLFASAAPKDSQRASFDGVGEEYSRQRKTGAPEMMPSDVSPNSLLLINPFDWGSERLPRSGYCSLRRERAAAPSHAPFLASRAVPSLRSG